MGLAVQEEGAGPAVPGVPDAVAAARWLSVAVGSLVVAGVFALVLVVGRTPVLAPLFSDPGFFRRCLVIHVDLALVIWFYASVAALAARQAGPACTVASRAGARLAVGAIGLLMLAAVLPGGRPVLSNYIPVIDSPVFAAGLVLFAAAAALGLLNARLFAAPAEGPGALPAEAVPFIRVAAVAFAFALAAFWGAWAATPSTLGPQVYYERVVWGGGHVLAFCSVAAMLAAWLVLVRGRGGAGPVLPLRAARLSAALLLAPVLAAPLLLVRGTGDPLYRRGFTILMEAGIFPVTLFVIVALARFLWRAQRGHCRDEAVAALLTSMALTVLGFALGFAIQGSNTMVPAHYHASLGGVTAAFMACAHGMAAGTDRRRPWELRARHWQVPVFGAGQFLFALGFALAGAHGAERKVYASEQQIRSAAERFGLGLMGLGGLVAAVGGILFLLLMLHAGRRALPVPAPAQQATPRLGTEGGHAYGN